MLNPACASFRSAVATLVDDEVSGLAPAERSSLEAHLASCAACAQLRTRLTRTNEALRALATPLPTKGEWARMIAKAAEAPVQAAAPSTWRWQFMAAAALVAALLPAGLWLALEPARPHEDAGDILTTRLDLGIL
jgi:anti-sigma factor RsiW